MGYLIRSPAEHEYTRKVRHCSRNRRVSKSLLEPVSADRFPRLIFTTNFAEMPSATFGRFNFDDRIGRPIALSITVKSKRL